MQKLKNKIRKEYQENKQDRKYVTARKKFLHLHEKLAHIKQRVHEYDVTNPAEQQQR